MASKAPAHRKNKILPHSLSIEGSIARPKMPASSFLHYYQAKKKALAEQWG